MELKDKSTLSLALVGAGVVILSVSTASLVKGDTEHKAISYVGLFIGVMLLQSGVKAVSLVTIEEKKAKA